MNCNEVTSAIFYDLSSSGWMEMSGLVELHLAFAFKPAGLNFDQICWLLGNHCSTTLKVLGINGTLFEDEDDDDFGITATGFGQLKRLRLERLVVWANDGTPCNVPL